MAWRELRRRWLRGGSDGGVGSGEGAGIAGAGATDEGEGAAGAGAGEGVASEGGAGEGGAGEWSPSAAEPLLYINCGGHEGLPSMLRRYERQVAYASKFLVSKHGVSVHVRRVRAK